MKYALATLIAALVLVAPAVASAPPSLTVKQKSLSVMGFHAGEQALVYVGGVGSTEIPYVYAITIDGKGRATTDPGWGALCRGNRFYAIVIDASQTRADATFSTC